MVQRSPYFKKIKYRQHLLVQILASQKKLMGVATNENIYALLRVNQRNQKINLVTMTVTILSMQTWPQQPVRKLSPNNTSCSSLILQIQLNWKHVPRQYTIQQSVQGAAASLGSPLPLTAVHHAADCHPLFSLHIQLLDRIFFNKSITFELLNSFSFTLVTM
jgi:hypothetical protein